MGVYQDFQDSMARYEIPYQNLGWDIPDRGTPFRFEGDTSNVFVLNQSDQLLRVPSSQWQGGLPGEISASQHEGLYRLLKDFREGQNLISSTYQQATSIPKTSGETITQTINPQNPQGTIRTSSLSGQISASPSLAEQTAKFGVTPEQLTSYQTTQIPTGTFQGGQFKPGQTAPKPVSILSSAGGEKLTANNLQKLGQAESSFIPLNQLAIEELSKKGFKEGDNLPGGKYKIGYENADNARAGLVGISSSPAVQGMVGEVNKLAQAGAVDQTKLDTLKQQEAMAMGALANARSSADSNNYRGLDFWVNKYNEIRTQYEADLSAYLRESQALRAKSLALMTPTQREVEVGKQLKDIRMEADNAALDLRKRQEAEFEGQTLQFAQGRAGALGRAESFAVQERLLKERNLLLELNLLTESRQMESKTIDQQLNFLKEDFELSNKINDRLNQQEESLFEKAQDLSTDAKNTLLSFIKNLEGINPTDMSPEPRAKLESLATQAGLPFDVVEEALGVSYKRQVFEDSLKTTEQRQAQERIDIERAQEIRLGAGDTGGLKASAGFFDSKIESSVREDFTELKGRYTNPTTPTDDEKNLAYVTLRGLYSPQEVTDDALRELIGISKPVDQSPEDVAHDWLKEITAYSQEQILAAQKGLGEFTLTPEGKLK